MDNKKGHSQQICMIVHFACLKSERAFIISKGEQIDIKEHGWENFQEKERNVNDCYSKVRRGSSNNIICGAYIDDTNLCWV